MEVKRMKTEAGYEVALKEIERRPSPKQRGGRLERENFQVPKTITYPKGKIEE